MGPEALTAVLADGAPVQSAAATVLAAGASPRAAAAAVLPLLLAQLAGLIATDGGHAAAEAEAAAAAKHNKDGSGYGSGDGGDNRVAEGRKWRRLVQTHMKGGWAAAGGGGSGGAGLLLRALGVAVVGGAGVVAGALAVWTLEPAASFGLGGYEWPEAAVFVNGAW
ncbi:hypothetical protein MNEG_2047 [Monoraphidium neglectum]|uniref:Uncharacterized protein n=1 Tax=Monoraphidium neglectum TaxID=145388 RepID=A0A0D2N029_9CHLO|nr:hypothetical protein MNEG_2047 [Monoraphidium neglectum]KIZ05912.1 hypothetical protein MNEG_2047 [Monoraphidium neglectum]|eukprot:XP_013904931.1 hypothetical protein MNEG_2047 [Monoraphidium neglectum]